MTPGKFRTDSLLFASVIIGTALIVVALTYLPGPWPDHRAPASGVKQLGSTS